MANKKNDTEEIKATAKTKDDEERVLYQSPFIEGEDPEETVIVNYEVTKFRKGTQVKIKKSVAKVLDNASKQNMAAVANQKKFEKQVMDL